VKHFATPEFWASRAALPAAIRQLADRSFERLERNPSHPALRLKKVGRYWSVRVGLHYRAPLPSGTRTTSSGSGSARMLNMIA
jgi:hypothetical protein